MTVQEYDAKELIRFAVDTVQQAGELALRYYGKGNPEIKFDEELDPGYDRLLQSIHQNLHPPRRSRLPDMYRGRR